MPCTDDRKAPDTGPDSLVAGRAAVRQSAVVRLVLLVLPAGIGWGQTGTVQPLPATAGGQPATAAP